MVFIQRAPIHNMENHSPNPPSTPDGGARALSSVLQDFTAFQRAEIDNYLTSTGWLNMTGLGLAAAHFIPGGDIATRMVMNHIFRASLLDMLSSPDLISRFEEKKQKKDIDIALSAVSDSIKLTNKLSNSTNQYSMGRFADPAKQPKDSIPPLAGVTADHASGRFRDYLEREGVDKAEAQRISALHQKFVESELPEISVLAAVQELRDQFHGEPVPSKRPYLGKTREKEFPDPRDFLMHYYGKEIEEGRMTTGRLQAIDPLLANSLYRDLGNQAARLQDLVEPKGKPSSRKIAACATILGATSLEETGRFFGAMRADRLAKYEAETAAGRKTRSPAMR